MIACVSPHMMAQPADTTPPLLQTAILTLANVITLTYNEILLPQLPAPSAFTVHTPVGTVNVLSVAASGGAIILTLAKPILAGITIDVSYVPPMFNPIRDAAGNAATGFAGYLVQH